MEHRSPIHRSGTQRHVCLFVRSLGGGGGAERVMLHLAAELAEQGHRVDFVMGSRKGRLLDQVPTSVELVDLAATTPLRSLPTLLRHMPGDALALLPSLTPPAAPRVLGSVAALASYLRSARPEAMLSALNYSNITALLARRLSRVPTRCVISVHNHLSSAASRSLDRRVQGMPALASRFFPQADSVVAVSGGVAEDLADILGEAQNRVTTIYNPVVTPRIAALAREPAVHPWFAAGAPPVVMGAGKLRRQKDFPTLIRAFARVRTERRARLLIVGEGEDRDALLSLARSLGVEDDVSLPGFVENPYALMANAGVFALSSAWEGFGNVLVEAMACGCPVVSTDCRSGPSEILAGGRYGSLVPVGDDAALAAAILAGLEKPDAREAARQRAAEFDATSSARRYSEVLLRST